MSTRWISIGNDNWFEGGEGMNLDIARLRELAQAATPGPWTVDEAELLESEENGKCKHGSEWTCHGPTIHGPEQTIPFKTTSGSAKRERVIATCSGYDACSMHGDNLGADFRYITAVSPDVLLALLDRLEWAERAVYKLKQVAEWEGDKYDSRGPSRWCAYCSWNTYDGHYPECPRVTMPEIWEERPLIDDREESDKIEFLVKGQSPEAANVVTRNPNMTEGTRPIGAGVNDEDILTLRSTDLVYHEHESVDEADTYGVLKKKEKE